MSKLRRALWIFVGCLLVWAGPAAARDIAARLPRRGPAAGDAAGLKPSGIKKVFKGPEGEVAAMVFLAPPEKKLILIRFDGTNTAWDGKVYLHKVHPAGLGEDYVADIDGKDYVTITMRDTYGKSYELYPPDKRESLRLRYSEAESKNVDPAAVVKQYQKESGR
jgi:hypothetical protein